VPLAELNRDRWPNSPKPTLWRRYFDKLSLLCLMFSYFWRRNNEQLRRKGRLYLFRCESAQGTLPPQPVQGRCSAHDRSPQAGLRPGSDQGKGPGRGQKTGRRPYQGSGAFSDPCLWAPLLQHKPLYLRKAQGRPQQHRRQPGRIHQGVLLKGQGHYRKLRLRGAYWQTRQGRQAFPPCPEIF